MGADYRTEKRWFCQMAVDGVSVIIPAYNVDGLLQDAYASVSARTDPVGQMIVVDDGSVDGTGKWLRDIAQKDVRFCLLGNEPFRDRPGAGNPGLKAARPSLVSRCSMPTIFGLHIRLNGRWSGYRLSTNRTSCRV